MTRDLQPIEDALRAAGEPELVHTWRRTSRELTAGPRAAVLASRADEAARARQELGDVGVLAMGLDPSDADRALPDGLREPLLGVHALIWATPATQPLGARERDALHALRHVGAPVRVVLLRDPDLLDELSDDPAGELAQIQARLASIAPDGWRVVVGQSPGVTALTTELRAQHGELTDTRLAQVAAHLLDRADACARRAVDEAADAVERLERALTHEDDALERARDEGRRAATYTLGVATRHTQALRVGLGTFLLGLQSDLPDQIDGLPHPEQARRVLPHWIEHVVHSELRDRIAAWRADVQHDLAHVPAAEGALAHAELLLPAVHPAPFPADGRWRRALGLTAGVGGAALLGALQLWIPAALAAGAGIAWSAFDRDPQGAQRDRLIMQAQRAVEQIGQQVDRVLAEQVDGFRLALADLGDAQATRLAEDRAETRAALTARRRIHQASLDQARSDLERFEGLRAALDPLTDFPRIEPIDAPLTAPPSEPP